MMEKRLKVHQSVLNNGTELVKKVFSDHGDWRLLALICLVMKTDQKFANGNTILHYAARTKDIKKLLMVACKIDSQNRNIINQFNPQGYHCIHYAVIYSTVEILFFLVQWGHIDINIQHALLGSTPLHIAINFRRYEMINNLLMLSNYGIVNMDIVDNNNQTAYELALQSNDSQVLSIFHAHYLNRTKVYHFSGLLIIQCCHTSSHVDDHGPIDPENPPSSSVLELKSPKGACEDKENSQ